MIISRIAYCAWFLDAGTRLVFIDASYRGFLFNPVNHLVLQIPKLSDNIKNVLWDAADWGVFAATDNKCVSLQL